MQLNIGKAKVKYTPNENWLNNQVDDGQKAADMRNMKSLYEITKCICNDEPCNSISINEKEGNNIAEDLSRLA